MFPIRPNFLYFVTNYLVFFPKMLAKSDFCALFAKMFHIFKNKLEFFISRNFEHILFELGNFSIFVQ